MRKSLVICPHCQINGKSQVLGEVDQFGHFVVMRFHKGFTRITGEAFTVICDRCNEAIYFRKGGQNALNSQRIKRLHWHSFSGTVGNSRTSDYQATSGTLT